MKIEFWCFKNVFTTINSKSRMLYKKYKSKQYTCNTLWKKKTFKRKHLILIRAKIILVVFTCTLHAGTEERRFSLRLHTLVLTVTMERLLHSTSTGSHSILYTCSIGKLSCTVIQRSTVLQVIIWQFLWYHYLIVVRLPALLHDFMPLISLC